MPAKGSVEAGNGGVPKRRESDGGITPPAVASGGASGSSGPLTRVTVNFTQRSMLALDSAVRKSGDTRTDTINRAIQVYDLVQDVLKRGDGRSLLIKYPNGECERLLMM